MDTTNFGVLKTSCTRICSLRPPSLECFSNELASSPLSSHPQLKISFSETALETTYQYPSESSVLEDLGPEPETPSAPTPLATQPDDDDDEEEEELLLQPGLQGGLRTKALIVGKQLAGGGRPLLSMVWCFEGAWPDIPPADGVSRFQNQRSLVLQISSLVKNTRVGSDGLEYEFQLVCYLRCDPGSIWA